MKVSGEKGVDHPARNEYRSLRRTGKGLCRAEAGEIRGKLKAVSIPVSGISLNREG